MSETTKIDQFILTGSKLGEGLFADVYKALSIASSKMVAIKVFKQKPTASQTQIQDYISEIKQQSHIKHKNVLSIDRIEMNGTRVIQRKNQSDIIDKVAYIVMDFMGGGLLLDYLAKGRISPQICRFYFKEILKGVHHMHSLNIYHLDLTPGNLLLDSKGQLKISDFGTSKKELRGIYKNIDTLGPYIAPESSMCLSEHECLLDLFSIAVILFNMVTGTSPFSLASNGDVNYKRLIQYRTDDFWAQFEQKIPCDFEFKDLINNMIDPLPQTRLTMAEVFGHPWLNEGPISTLQEIHNEFKSRMKDHVDHSIEIKESSLATGILLFNVSLDQILPVDKDSSKITKLNSSSDPYQIMNEVISLLKDSSYTNSVNQNSIKISTDAWYIDFRSFDQAQVRIELFSTGIIQKEEKTLNLRSTAPIAPTNKVFQLEFINKRVAKSTEFYAIYRQLLSKLQFLSAKPFTKSNNIPKVEGLKIKDFLDLNENKFQLARKLKMYEELVNELEEVEVDDSWLPPLNAKKQTHRYERKGAMDQID